jgi:hypothetical protein
LSGLSELAEVFCELNEGDAKQFTHLRELSLSALKGLFLMMMADVREVKGFSKRGAINEREALCVALNEVRRRVEGARRMRVRKELKAC